MDGPTVYRHAVRLMTEVTEQAVRRAGLTVADIDLFVYHQANSRIIDAVGQKRRLDRARVVDVVGLFANTSAASLPIPAAADRDGGCTTVTGCCSRRSAPGWPGAASLSRGDNQFADRTTTDGSLTEALSPELSLFETPGSSGARVAPG